LKKSGAGDSPAPVGDPPTGIAKMKSCENTASYNLEPPKPFSDKPFGESPVMCLP